MDNMFIVTEHGPQDAVRCHLCKTAVPTEYLMFCKSCHVHLCKTCVREHIRKEIGEHKVVPFEERILPPHCSKHCTKVCEL